MHPRVERLPSGHVVVTLRGELDLASQRALQDDFEQALDISSSILVDLTEVTFADSTILAVLVWAQRRASERGGSVALLNPQPILSKVLAITHIDRAVRVHRSLEEALSAAVAGR